MPQEAPRQAAWQQPDPVRLLATLREMRLNDEQIAAATSYPNKPKMIIAGLCCACTSSLHRQRTI